MSGQNYKTQNTKHKKTRVAEVQGEEDFSWGDDVDDAVLCEDAAKYNGSGKVYDLEERTAIFGERVIRLCKKIPRHPANDRINGQLAGAGTSLGANYVEATERLSRRDFRAIISRCVKETKETRFFLRMLAAAEPSLKIEARDLYREASELLRIFGSMYQK